MQITTIQDMINQETRDGRLIIRFLVSTMTGSISHAKPCHRMDAAKYLIKLGFEDDLSSSTTTTSTAGTADARPTPTPIPQNRPDPLLPQKLIADEIIYRTGTGASIVNFLDNVMSGRHPHAKPQHRLNAAIQMLSIRFQDRFQPRRVSSTQQDNLTKKLEQHTRETTNPRELVGFLIDVMDSGSPDYTTDISGRTATYNLHQSLRAADELLQRGFNTFTSEEIDQARSAPVIHTTDCGCPPKARLCLYLYSIYQNSIPEIPPRLIAYDHIQDGDPIAIPYTFPGAYHQDAAPSQDAEGQDAATQDAQGQDAATEDTPADILTLAPAPAVPAEEEIHPTPVPSAPEHPADEDEEEDADDAEIAQLLRAKQA